MTTQAWADGHQLIWQTSYGKKSQFLNPIQRTTCNQVKLWVRKVAFSGRSTSIGCPMPNNQPWKQTYKSHYVGSLGLLYNAYTIYAITIYFLKEAINKFEEEWRGNLVEFGRIKGEVEMLTSSRQRHYCYI